jgi:ribosomal protein S3
MGQKVHPLGFRVGITTSYQSQWFARFHKKQYAQSVLEDRMLRRTLFKLFPELLNPTTKTNQKVAGGKEKSAQMTHIKIERGLIPYEIGIQIHAVKPERLKTAIQNLKVNPNLLHNLQKTRQYLLNLKTESTNDVTVSFKESVQKKTFTQLGSKVNLEKRYRRRKVTRSQFRQTLLENLMIVKQGKKIVRKLQTKMNVSSLKKITNSNPVKGQFKGNKYVKNTKAIKTSRVPSIFGQAKNTKKFVNVFVSKMNQQFLNVLKIQLIKWNEFLKNHKEQQLRDFQNLQYAPLGYQRKWSLSTIKNYKNYDVAVLNKLLKNLQKKAIEKMKSMEKNYTVLGVLSRWESFKYYQMIRFIKALKNLIQKMKTEQSYLIKQKTRRPGFDSNPQMQNRLESSLLALSERALRKKQNNISDECRKVKFIDYLKDLVKKHRQKNIYLYLATISDSRKYLRKLKQFTKQQAGFLFGLDLQAINEFPVEKRYEFVRSQVTKTLKQVVYKNKVDSTLQETFIQNLVMQRKMNEQNIELTPKISIKFYSVKLSTYVTKASSVAESIADDLEKRKAFRKVIKQAKEDLMSNPKVKGVKIQVSGRLNGAEIARSEWVRAGRVPLQTLRANIDYCYKTASTIYGIIGVKVWIYKGYIKPKKESSTLTNFFQLTK